MEHELVLLLPENKPPFIGIDMGQNEAETSNTDLILLHKKRNFKIILEPHKDKLNLRLACEEIVSVRFYNHLKYKPDKLASWLYMVQHKKSSVINFSQVFFRGDKVEVARTAQQNKPFVLKISKIEIVKIPS